MPDEDGQDRTKEPIPPRPNFAYVIVVFIKAVEDVLNGRGVMIVLLVILLLLTGRVALPELGQVIEGWIRAWKGVP